MSLLVYDALMVTCTTTERKMIDAYLNIDDRGSHPYRVRINGQFMRNKAGEVRKFRTLNEAIRAAKDNG
jgi:hypothetical protein